MIAAGITNRTPALRPFISCGSPGSRRIPSLYITHAHHVNNATPQATFHNIIDACAAPGRAAQGFIYVPIRLRFFCRATSILTLVTLMLSTAPAQARGGKRSARPSRVQTGLDVLETQKFAPLRNKHIGLITNHTAVDAQGRSIVDLLSRAAGVHLVALFSPEHGLMG